MRLGRFPQIGFLSDANAPIRVQLLPHLNHCMKTLALAVRRLFTLLVLVLLPALTGRADDPIPPNLGRGLRHLVEWQRTQAPAPSDEARSAALQAHLGTNALRVQTDTAGNVTADVRLDGAVPAAEIKERLAALGLGITGEHVARRPDGRDGMLTVHLPLAQAAAVAKIPGVFSVLVAHAPRPRVGEVTSQGVAALHADEAQASGYDGRGITVGVISDSYDVATEQSVGYAVTTHAAQDIATGDLPGPGNPYGYTTPIYVLQDGNTDPNQGNTDEGRAILQIVHDMAPAATLAFCTSGESQTTFANNIERLRTNAHIHADIIMDDIGFDDEPFFSDGMVAQAVDDVVTSTSLAGRPVLYYSAAGNDGDVSYAATFTPISNATVRATGASNLQFDQVPDNLTVGGFHNFKAAATGGGVSIAQKVIVSATDATFNFQWDDPFIPGKITANYNLLVFDADGQYRSDLSGIDDNFNTGEAIQEVDLPLKNNHDTTYQIVLALGRSTPPHATHLRYILEGEATVEGKYLQTGQPTLFGHSGAQNADGVSAYYYADLSAAESFASFGPVTIYFDENGDRLATPIVRAQPTIAAVDGVDTTFFQEGPLADADSDSDGFPNFFGTSAAAPHAAGVAALLLQAAGGKGSLSAAQMRSLLQSTAASHDLNPAESVANFTSSDGLFSGMLVAHGDASDNSSISTRFFTLTFIGPAGSNLRRAAINAGPAAEDFDESSDHGSLSSGIGGFPFTIGLVKNVNTAGITSTLTANGGGKARTKLSVIAGPGAFPSGGLLSFGVDRDAIATGDGGNDADVLAGATVTVRFTLAGGGADSATGTLTNQYGHGYSPDAGYGLIDAEAALKSLLGQ
jgi:hypothetical protein